MLSILDTYRLRASRVDSKNVVFFSSSEYIAVKKKKWDTTWPSFSVYVYRKKKEVEYLFVIFWLFWIYCYAHSTLCIRFGSKIFAWIVDARCHNLDFFRNCMDEEYLCGKMIEIEVGDFPKKKPWNIIAYNWLLWVISNKKSRMCWLLVISKSKLGIVIFYRPLLEVNCSP